MAVCLTRLYFPLYRKPDVNVVKCFPIRPTRICYTIYILLHIPRAVVVDRRCFPLSFQSSYSSSSSVHKWTFITINQLPQHIVKTARINLISSSFLSVLHFSTFYSRAHNSSRRGVASKFTRHPRSARPLVHAPRFGPDHISTTCFTSLFTAALGSFRLFRVEQSNSEHLSSPPIDLQHSIHLQSSSVQQRVDHHHQPHHQ